MANVLNTSSLVKLDISFHIINDKTASTIAVILSHNTKLEELNIDSCNLQTTRAVKIFQGMKSMVHLSKLNISHNSITDEVMDDLTKILSKNVNLKELDLGYNCIQATGASKVLRGMKSILHLSKFCIGNSSVTNEVADDLAEILSQNFELKEIDLSNNCLQAKGASTVCKGLGNFTNLTKLCLSDNKITDEAVHDVAAVLSQNKFLEELDISYNNLGVSDALQIFLSMKSFKSLIKLNVCGIGMDDSAANDVAAILNNNIKLKELNLSHNNIQAWGAIQIFRNIISNLHKLNISHNNITEQAADELASFISQNAELEELDLCHDKLQADGAAKICKTNISNLIKFKISHNSITDQAADDIALLISHNTKLEELDLSHNKLQADGAVKICKTTISNLIKFKISHNNITDQAADDIVSFISHNTKLEVLDLSHNKLEADGAVKICKLMFPI